MKSIKKIKPIFFSIALLVLIWTPFRLDYYPLEVALTLTATIVISAFIWRRFIMDNSEIVSDLVAFLMLSVLMLSGIFNLNKEWSPLLATTVLIVIAALISMGLGIFKKYRQNS